MHLTADATDVDDDVGFVVHAMESKMQLVVAEHLLSFSYEIKRTGKGKRMSYSGEFPIS